MAGRLRDRLAATMDDPRRGLVASWILLGLCMHIAFLIRYSIVIDGALDTDVINFGLAAFRFDVLDHQPQPPGYPGYVMLLKLVHLAFPALLPLEVAEWTCRLTGVLTIPAAYWACRQILAVPGRSDPRPFMAAALAVVHPLLWYYGGDGQSHDVEALATLLLFGGAMRVRRMDGRGRFALVAACALAGSLRPTIALLVAPMLLWTFWRRPLRDWIAATVIGVAFVAIWYVPLVLVSGGWGLYSRSESALVRELFISNFSVFGGRARVGFVTVNMTTALYAFLEALLPLVALGRRGGAWRRPWWLTMVASFLFYALVYCAEPGYFTGVAGLACLVPATWDDRPTLGQGVRGALAWLTSVAFMLFGPSELPRIHWSGGVFAPTLAHVADVEAFQRQYRAETCVSPDGAPVFVVTDNPVTTHTRLLPVKCPGVTLGLYLYDNPLNRKLDNWLLFYADGMDTLPTEVPLETGGGAEATLRAPVGWVLRAPDASEKLDAALARVARCASLPVEKDGVRIWPARCLPGLRFGANVVHVPGL